jgi:L-alanine-DL-glutamate epimerase-like enolase superfamily enzyme
MKITEIETLPVSVGAGYDYAVIIVLVRTDEGLTGIGEASLAGRGRGVFGILDHFTELLVGQDPTKIEHWWSELVRGTFWSTGQVILAAGEVHGQRSALHHASSPVNGTACLHVDMAVPNFDIQEWMELEPLYELFPNAPRAHAGYASPPAGPGLGLELDETESRKRPSRDARLPQRYWPDGSVGDY